MILTQAEATARVAKGADHLDLVRPSWFEHIDQGTLEISLCTRCVVGQLCGLGRSLDSFMGYNRNVTALFPIQSAIDAWQYGVALSLAEGRMNDSFLFDDYQDPYALLRTAWIEAIETRRVRAAACLQEVGDDLVCA